MELTRNIVKTPFARCILADNRIFLNVNSITQKTIRSMTSIQEITQALIAFRDARDWAQFHNPKDLALALNVESAELLELFLWKDAAQADRDKVKEELADVLAYALLLAHNYGFDVAEIMEQKIKINGEKYPIDKSRGVATKYSAL
jgi:NTP pyrophosphatase (non-canonical NTP hydrolase)